MIWICTNDLWDDHMDELFVSGHLVRYVGYGACQTG